MISYDIGTNKSTINVKYFDNSNSPTYEGEANHEVDGAITFYAFYEGCGIYQDPATNEFIPFTVTVGGATITPMDSLGTEADLMTAFSATQNEIYDFGNWNLQNECKGVRFKTDTSDFIKIKNPSAAGYVCLLYTSPSPRDLSTSRMPSSA